MFILTTLLLLLAQTPPEESASVDSTYAQYLECAEAPFIVIDKPALTLTLVGSQGEVLKQYGISCAVNYGPKKVSGDHKTPEGVFKINQLLYAKGLSHDFRDGKGPVKDAYGPWFLRLDVPGFWDIGIHGTPFPESIGTRATEGCIRLRNNDIMELKNLVKVGTDVIILPDTEL